MSRFGGTRVFVAAVTLVVAAVVATAIVVLGSPAEQRMIRLDQRRVSDLVALGNAINMYVENHEKLPPDLAAAATAPYARVKLTDPETAAPYEYQLVDEKSYKLCAVFARRSENDRAAISYTSELGWDHEAGRQCFDRVESKKK
jgi:CRISPR/Cas system-associated exonuclease Cas4 (RecB family)